MQCSAIFNHSVHGCVCVVWCIFTESFKRCVCGMRKLVLTTCVHIKHILMMNTFCGSSSISLMFRCAAAVWVMEWFYFFNEIYEWLLRVFLIKCLYFIENKYWNVFNGIQKHSFLIRVGSLLFRAILKSSEISWIDWNRLSPRKKISPLITFRFEDKNTLDLLQKSELTLLTLAIPVSQCSINVQPMKIIVSILDQTSQKWITSCIFITD